MSYNAQFVSALKEALNGLRTIHAVGEEWCSYIGQIPTGGVPYCGQEVTRSTYSALWQYAQSQGLVKSESEWQSIASAQGGNVPFYSSGDGSSTFRMPRLVGYVRGASGQSEAGAYVKEGLPNIEGSYSMTSLGKSDDINAKTNGALYSKGIQSDVKGTSLLSTVNGVGIGFDASRSNPIYGNSDHVTPETSVVLFGVYAFGEVNNVDALDAGALASALARVESNMVDKTSAHIVETWRSGDSWYRKYSDGWIEQGGVLSTGPNAEITVTFPVEFSDTNYHISKNNNWWADGDMMSMYINFFRKTTTSASTYNSNIVNLGTGMTWRACGY